MEIKRGQIYYADLSPVQGSEQGGLRPVLIVQNDVGNKHAPTVIVVPLTTRMTKHKLPTHHLTYATGVPSIILCEQVRTADKGRLKQYMTTLSPAEMEKVNRALKISLGI
jgi:mRNA interferase MazF